MTGKQKLSLIVFVSVALVLIVYASGVFRDAPIRITSAENSRLTSASLDDNSVGIADNRSESHEALDAELDRKMRNQAAQEGKSYLSPPKTTAEKEVKNVNTFLNLDGDKRVPKEDGDKEFSTEPTFPDMVEYDKKRLEQEAESSAKKIKSYVETLALLSKVHQFQNIQSTFYVDSATISAQEKAKNEEHKVKNKRLPNSEESELQDKESPIKEVVKHYKAGDVLLAVTDTRINSDLPNNTVVANIISYSDPLKGATLMGTFSPTDDGFVSLEFQTASLKKGSKSQSISAIAMDQSVAQLALQGQVDKHNLLRYSSAIGYSFMKGFGSLAELLLSQGSVQIDSGAQVTTTTPELSASDKNTVLVAKSLDAGVELFSEQIKENISRKPTVTREKGHVFGLMFTQDFQLVKE